MSGQQNDSTTTGLGGSNNPNPPPQNTASPQPNNPANQAAPSGAIPSPGSASGGPNAQSTGQQSDPKATDAGSGTPQPSTTDKPSTPEAAQRPAPSPSPTGTATNNPPQGGALRASEGQNRATPDFKTSDEALPANTPPESALGRDQASSGTQPSQTTSGSQTSQAARGLGTDAERAAQGRPSIQELQAQAGFEPTQGTPEQETKRLTDAEVNIGADPQTGAMRPNVLTQQQEQVQAIIDSWVQAHLQGSPVLNDQASVDHLRDKIVILRDLLTQSVTGPAIVNS